MNLIDPIYVVVEYSAFLHVYWVNLGEDLHSYNHEKSMCTMVTTNDNAEKVKKCVEKIFAIACLRARWTRK